MAKKIHSYSFKGQYFHDEGMIIMEYDNKTDETRYYRLEDILKEFDESYISIVIKEESQVPSLKNMEGSF